MKKVCAHCGAEFEPVKVFQKYCGKSCWAEHNRRVAKLKYIPVQRVKIAYHFEPIVRGFCFACHKKFKRKFAGEKFCSDACREKYFKVW